MALYQCESGLHYLEIIVNMILLDAVYDLFSFYRTYNKNCRKIQIHFLLMRFVFGSHQLRHYSKAFNDQWSQLHLFILMTDTLLQYWKSSIPWSTTSYIFQRSEFVFLVFWLFYTMTDEKLVHGFLLAHVTLLQVLSLCDHPALLDKSETHALYRYLKTFSIR